MKSKTYEEFVDKFKPKLTTDDCFTPPPVYEAVKNWVCREYGIDDSQIVRPFWPGGDYENSEYPEGCVVVDNPPFSKISEICVFFEKRKIRYFLFAPGNVFTAFGRSENAYIIQDAEIIYENGAIVKTNFVTNLAGDIAAESRPDLGDAIRAAVDECQRQKKAKSGKKELPKYVYPDAVITAAMMQRLAKYHVKLTIRRRECAFVRKLDAQAEHGKTIFGGGLLLSEHAAAERAAAEHAAAERAAAIHWELSEREWEIVRRLGANEETEG